jgi:hypothetical protein
MDNMNYNADSVARYLRQEMPPDERRAFEAALRTDRALLATYLAQSATPAGQAIHLAADVRSVAQALRQQRGPLPEPQITLLDKIRFLLYEPLWRWSVVLLSVTVVAAVVYSIVGSGEKSFSKAELGALIERHFLPPECTTVAGQSNQPTAAELALLHRSSEFYCGVRTGGGDSLAALTQRCGTDFCFARFYLAHWQLRQSQYAAAQAGLAECVKNRKTLENNTYTDNIGKLRFNALLAELGATGDATKVRTQLEQFAQEADCQGDVKKHTLKLIEQLR